MSRKWAYLPALVAALTLPLSAQDIFVTPPDALSTVLGVYRAEPFASAGNATGPAGTMMVLRASGTKVYAITRNALDAVVALEGTAPTLTIGRRISFQNPVVAAAMSPDNRRLVVITNNVHIIDTATDTDLTGAGLDAGSSPSSIAISLDSTRAFVLSPNSQRLTAIDLNTNTVASTQTIPGIASRVAVAPNGLVYVTAPNALLEYDSRTLTNTGTISMNAFPGTATFTPDGRFAILLNTDPRTGSSLIAVDLQLRTVVTAPLLGSGAGFNEVIATGNTTALAFSNSTGRLYRIQLTPGSTTALSPQEVSFGSIALDSVYDIDVSHEFPPRYVFLTTQIGLFRYDVQTASVSGPLNIPFVGNVSATGRTTTTGATTITALRGTQTIGSGQTSAPVVVRVVDANGNPVSGVAINFTASNGGTISAPMSATNNQGLASAYVVSPTGFNGVITATATAAGVAAPANFTITVGTGGGGTGGPSGLTVVSGSGQALPQFQTTQTSESLRVQLRDAAGNPVSGATITWSVVGGGSVTPTTTTTDQAGVARADFITNVVQAGIPYTTSTITASTGTQSVDLYVTTIANQGNQPNGLPGFLNTYARQATSEPLTGRAGETLGGAIRYDVVTSSGARVPFIGIRAQAVRVNGQEITTDPQGNPVVQCRGGIQFSDAEGVASCDLVIGNVTGEIEFDVYVGATARRDSYRLTVAAAPPAVVVAAQGGNQSGNPGQRLPTALLAQVLDAFNNPLNNVPVEWQVISGSATLADVGSTTDINGRVSAFVVLGNTPGPVQVRVRPVTGTGSAVFNLTVNAAAAGIEKVAGGDNQTALTGQAFGQPLAVRVANAAGQPVSGATVTFTVTSGSVTITSASSTTDANGVASATVQAGNSAGPAVVTATSGAFSTAFNLTVRSPGPVFTAASIVNGAGFQPGISPGTIAVISGTGIAPNVRGTVTPNTIVGPLPTRLADVEVTFNNIPAPIFSVTNNNGAEQVVVQVPYEVAPGTATVTVRSQGGGSTSVSGVQILPLKPGIFEYVDTDGQRYAVATRPDGSYVSLANPARRGEIIRFFATGLGAVTPASGTNRVGVAGQNVVAPVVVGLNDSGTRVVSAELLPGAVGVYVIAFEVPANTTAGPRRNFAIAVTGTDGQPVFGNGTSLPVQ